MVKAATASYTQAVASAAQYTVELDAGEAKLFRERLERIRSEVEKAAYPGDWSSIQASFRNELREHRDRSVAQLIKLRAELTAAAAAMGIFADSVASSGADHKEELQEALGKLDSAVQQDSLMKVRATLREAKAHINATVEHMEHAHQFMIAQLRDEIGTLHHKMDADRRAEFLDGATGLWNRLKLDSELQQMLDHDESFCLLVVGIRNLKRLDQHYSPAVIQSGIKALLQRLSAMLGKDAILGRWEDEIFAAILQIDPAVAISLSREATARLSGGYSVQDNGVPRNIEIQATAGVIERQHGTESASFHKNLLQLSATLSHA